MHRALLVAVCVMLSACATPPEVFGLSRHDVREITAVVNQRPDIRKPILRIASFQPGHADVRTGRDYTAGDRINTFEMAKRGGRWTIISAIEDDQIIVTSADAHRLR